MCLDQAAAAEATAAKQSQCNKQEHGRLRNRDISKGAFGLAEKTSGSGSGSSA